MRCLGWPRPDLFPEFRIVLRGREPSAEQSLEFYTRILASVHACTDAMKKILIMKGDGGAQRG